MPESPFITVRFSDVEEFLEELAPKPGRGVECIEQVIRVTKSFTRSKSLPLQYVSVVAAMLRDVAPTVQLIKFERECGQYMGKDSVSEATLQRAESIQKQIEAFAAKWKLQVRAGYYE